MRWTTVLTWTAATLALASAPVRAAEPPAAPALLAAVTAMTVHDGDGYAARRDAVVALGSDAVPGLRALSASTASWRVAAAADAAAGWIEHGELYARFEATDPRPTRGMTLSYVAFADDSATLVPLLVERLTWTEADPGRRMAIIDLLRRAGDARATAALGHALLRDDVQGVRAAAAAALERADDPEATALLVQSLASEPEVLVRRSVAGSLGWRRDAAATPALVDVLRADDDGTCRAAAAQALGWIADPEATAPLIAALRDDEDPRVRGRAALALGTLGGDEAAAALERAATDDPDGEVVRLVGVALSRL